MCASLSRAGAGVTTLTHPKELSPSLKAVMQPRDRADRGTWSVQGVFGGDSKLQQNLVIPSQVLDMGKGRLGP